MKKSDTKIYRFATLYHIVEEIENYERIGGPNVLVSMEYTYG